MHSDIDITVNIKDNFSLQLKDLGIVKEEILGIKLEIVEGNCVIRLVQKNGIRYDIIISGGNNKEVEDEIKMINKSEMFVAILSLGKLMRNDYLISAHLAHMLCMDSLVEQMIERDLEFNTNFHRYGYKECLNYYDTYKNINNNYCNTDSEIYNHISKLLISGIENIKSISNEEKKIFYEIWNFGDNPKQIKDVIFNVAKQMEKDVKMIAKVAFIIMVLSTAWNIEDNETQIVDRNYNICKELIKYM